MPSNPERMRPTDASMAPIVIEANAIVFHAANQVVKKERAKSFLNRNGQLIIAAGRFMKGITTS